MFIAALFTTAKTWKQTKCPSTDKEVVVCIYTMEHYSAIRKTEILSFAATRMNLENIVLSEASQTKTDKHYHI